MYKKLFLDWYSEFWHFAFALKICTNIKKSVNKKIYLNIIQCLWSFSWRLAVRPNSDRRLCAYMFFFSLFFFLFSIFSPLSLCFHRQSWQHNTDLEIWLMCFFWGEVQQDPSLLPQSISGKRLGLSIIFDFGSSLGSHLQDSASAFYITSVLKSEGLAVPILQTGFWETGGIMPNASKIFSGG